MPKAYSPILEGERPNAPTVWAHAVVSQSKARELGLCPPDATMVSYDLTWHHNIPWKTLRESWNVIFVFFDAKTVSDYFHLLAAGNPTCRDALKLGRKLVALKEGLGLNAKNASGATYAKWVERLSSDEKYSLLDTFANEKKLVSDDSEALYSIVAWQSWNIVEGPKENVRVEDPGSDDFDDFRFLDPSKYERFQRLYLLYEELQRVIAQYTHVSGQFCDLSTVSLWEKTFKATLELARPLATHRRIMFDPKYWKVIKVHNQPVKATGATQNVYAMARNLGVADIYHVV